MKRGDQVHVKYTAGIGYYVGPATYVQTLKEKQCLVRIPGDCEDSCFPLRCVRLIPNAD
jgi:hypothetical protein